METINYLKSQLYFLIIPTIAIAVGLIWPSFYWLGVGIIVASIIVVNTICCMFKKDRTDDDYFTGPIGGCALVIIAVIFTVMYWNFDATRYITRNGKALHLYEDCSSFPKGSEVKEVVEVEGFLHLCFKDCKVCLARQEKDREEKRIEAQKRKEEIARARRNGMIDVLLDAIEKLRNGENARIVGEELDGYLYEEGYCNGGYEEEYEDRDYNWGIPSRYQ